MNQSLLLTAIVVLIGSANPAKAQYQPTESKAEYLPIPGRSLETRFQDCIEDPDCTTQEHLMLMEEMGEEITRALQRMNRTCMDLDYTDCIDPQSAPNEEWHKLHNHMGDMMTSLEMNALGGMGPFMTEYEGEEETETEYETMMDEETGEAMSAQEPASGPAEESEIEENMPEKTQKENTEEGGWWQKIFRKKDDMPEADTTIQYD